MRAFVKLLLAIIKMNFTFCISDNTAFRWLPFLHVHVSDATEEEKLQEAGI